MTADYCIIGGGIAGTTAAETIRARDPKGSIVLVEREPHRLYSRIVLSKENFFSPHGELPSPWLRSEEWYKRSNIIFRPGHTVSVIDSHDRTITLDDGTSIAYKKLLLALGTEAAKPSVPGVEKGSVYTLRTLDDAYAIRAALPKVARVAVVGSGFIGFEMASIARSIGCTVTLIMRNGQLWNNILHPEGSRILESAMEQRNIRIVKNSRVVEIIGTDSVRALMLDDGTSIPCELALFGIGVSYPTDPFRKAGIATRNGIMVNEFLETNIPGIWAAGDIADIENDSVNHQRGNWSGAQTQGSIAGKNMTGERTKFSMVSAYTTAGAGMTLAFIGNTEHNHTEIRTSAKGSQPSFRQFFIQNGVVVGAILINALPDLGPVTRAIARNTPYTELA
ncbi:MAG: FAD-dependent oxidoreductase [Patescibacteria group bacterium]